MWHTTPGQNCQPVNNKENVRELPSMSFRLNIKNNSQKVFVFLSSSVLLRSLLLFYLDTVYLNDDMMSVLS